MEGRKEGARHATYLLFSTLAINKTIAPWLAINSHGCTMRAWSMAGLAGPQPRPSDKVRPPGRHSGPTAPDASPRIPAGDTAHPPQRRLAGPFARLLPPFRSRNPLHTTAPSGWPVCGGDAMGPAIRFSRADCRLRTFGPGNGDGDSSTLRLVFSARAQGGGWRGAFVHPHALLEPSKRGKRA